MRFKRIALLGIIIATFTHSYQAWCQDLDAKKIFFEYSEQLKNSYKKGDYTKDDYNKFLQLLEFNLGLMYEKGLGVDIDRPRALKSYKSAAQNGLVQAQFILGSYYARMRGSFISPSLMATEAKKYYTMAAESDPPHPEAMVGLGNIYEGVDDQGKDKSYAGVSKSIETAAEWYEKADKLGVPEASYRLGYLYENECTHGSFNTEELYNKAANKHFPLAEYRLALLYKGGEDCVTKDLQRAAELFIEAGKDYLKKKNLRKADECRGKAADLIEEHKFLYLKGRLEKFKEEIIKVSQ